MSPTPPPALDEADFGVLIWINPAALPYAPRTSTSHGHAPYLLTLTAHTSSHSPHSKRPLALLLTRLRREHPYATLLASPELITLALTEARLTAQRPAIVPLPLARSVLGWEAFIIEPAPEPPLTSETTL